MSKIHLLQPLIRECHQQLRSRAGVQTAPPYPTNRARWRSLPTSCTAHRAAPHLLCATDSPQQLFQHRFSLAASAHHTVGLCQTGKPLMRRRIQTKASPDMLLPKGQTWRRAGRCSQAGTIAGGLWPQPSVARCAYSTASTRSPRSSASSAARARRAFWIFDPHPNCWPADGAWPFWDCELLGASGATLNTCAAVGQTGVISKARNVI